MALERPELLALVLITDGRGDLARLERIVTAAVDGGVRCVQLREPTWSARQLADCASRLRSRLEKAGGLLLVNDRVDVAAAGHAHGVWLGRRSLPAEQARAVLGADSIVAFSAHDQAELAAAAAAGCDFASLSPVWATASKPGQRPLGIETATLWTRAVALPVVWLGGITAAQAGPVGASPAAGAAVLSSIMAAADPHRAAADLLAALRS